ncbi:MAG: choice-of-anchor J domain-containing protein, partial [Bacteroidales bacterium]|nr:choice-of-anchor J domain-containing protein [Bacteroidales bacterium]
MKKIFYFLLAMIFAIQGWTQTPATLPYSCDFENATENSEWLISNGAAVNSWYIGQAVSATPISGNSLYISNDSGVSNAYTTGSTSVASASRIIEFDGSGSYALSFNLRLGGESSWDFVKVFLVDTNVAFPGGTSLPTWASTSYSTGVILYNGTNPYYNNVGSPNNVNNIQIIIPSQGPAGTVKKIVFVWRNDSGGGTQPPASIDNIALRALTCSAPTAPIGSNATTTSFDLSWTDPNNASSWIVEYKLSSSSTWIAEEATTNPYTISNLSSSSSYQARVYAVCTPGDTSFASPTINYATACDVISTFPWIEGFEATPWAAAVLPGNALAPNCWININGGYSSTSYIWRRTSTASYVHSGTGAAQMYTSSSDATSDWLITPPITLTGGERLRFWAKGYSTYIDKINVRIYDISTNSADISSINDTALFIEIMPNTLVSSAAWTDYEINLSQYSGDYRIAFVRNTTGGYYLNLDDVEISELPACIRPTSVAISNITSDGADISWVNGSQADASWWLYYKPTSASDFDSVQIFTNPYTIQNFSPATNYQVYLKTDCSTELSEASNTLSFQTACVALTIPTISEGFDAVPPSSCWERKQGILPATGNASLSTTTSGWYLNSSVTPSNAKVNIYYTSCNYWLISPSIDLGDGTSPAQIEFDVFYTAYGSTNSAGTSGTDDRFAVVVSTDNGNTWNATNATIWSNDASATRVLNNIPNTPTHIILPLFDPATTLPYTGIVKIGFYGESTVSNADNDLHIDNFAVVPTPDCPNVYGLIAQPATTSSVSVNWNDEGDEGDGYVIAYSSNLAVPFDPTTATTVTIPTGTTLPYIIQGFNAGDSVWVAVQRGCGGTWTTAQKVILPSFAYTLPFTSNFEDTILDTV